MQQLYTRQPGKQGGATLLVALIMLLLLSLLGTNSLKTALFTERLAAAEYKKNITFQASESAAAIATDRTSQILADVIRTNSPVSSQTIDIDSDQATATVSAEPLGTGAMLGSSIGPVSGFRVKVTSIGELTGDPGSHTTTVHGITRMGAGG